MRLVWSFVLFFVVIGARATEKQCALPIWTSDISAKYQFRPFGRVSHPRNQPPWPWKISQGVVFTSPTALAVYQVLETDENNPRPRDESGGGGKYVLQIVFLDTATGREMKTLRFTTTGLEVSGVFPTHEGRFVVVTGQQLRLYSATFEQIGSRTFPTSPYGKPESWSVSVIPGGKRICISAMEHYLLDSDTLETIWNPKPGDVAFWGKGNRFFPELRGSGPGVFNNDGLWVNMDLGSASRDSVLSIFLTVPDRDSGGWAPKELRIFSASGQIVWSVKTRDMFTSFSSNGALIASAIYKDRPNPFDLDLVPKPVQIAVYDLNEKVERCSIRISLSTFYDLSLIDGLAVIQGGTLSLYRLTSP
jgi:hypothetical protein